MLRNEIVISTLEGQNYICSEGLSMPFLALIQKRPLFLEGEAGVGKTEIAKVLAQVLGRDLIRLQCYEGLDIHQAYEWNIIPSKAESDLFNPDCIPSILPLLIDDLLDEIRRHFYKILSDWQITIPEMEL